MYTAETEENFQAMGTISPRQPKNLAAGPFQAAINSFTLHLHAERKAEKTVRTYVLAARWFAAEHLLGKTEHTDWDEVVADDIRAWTVWLLERYSDSYANNQYRALQQFFKQLVPMTKPSPPTVGERVIPVFKAVLRAAPRLRDPVAFQGGRASSLRTGRHPVRLLSPAQRPLPTSPLGTRAGGVVEGDDVGAPWDCGSTWTVATASWGIACSTSTALMSRQQAWRSTDRIATVMSRLTIGSASRQPTAALAAPARTARR
ncbi:phage integrase N-terminal SAM-like domain-containing protein [Actinomadura macrotermitis]|uniref:phage integrase N-terminal SAM-like domain-containing protein n=1 Tax=Actinomadura macrotermitis TaxID=2585200 RepID=UPI001295014E|nr:phage integrase N-terminal SAM-like domain-containing protein [Actinomadura macrotermitis]